MNILLLIVAIGLSSEYALMMIVLGWPTRIILVAFLIGLAYFSAKRHGNHHGSNVYDSRLTDARMDHARELLISVRLENENPSED